MATEDRGPGQPADRIPAAGRIGPVAAGRAVLKDERITYLMTGLFNTAFAFILFASLQLALGHRVHYLLILLIAHVVGVLEAFTMYRLRVFKVKGNLVIDLLRFWSVNLGALGINLAMLPVLVEAVHMPVILGQVVVLCTVTLGTYLAHKHYSFRRTAGRA